MSFMSFASEMLGNLFKPPATSQYPFKPRKVYEADRGKVINDINNCIFCGMCMRNCPSDAITVDRNARTWKINRFACVQCKECVTNCPKKSLSMDTEYTAPATESTKGCHRRGAGEKNGGAESVILCMNIPLLFKSWISLRKLPERTKAGSAVLIW